MNPVWDGGIHLESERIQPKAGRLACLQITQCIVISTDSCDYHRFVELDLQYSLMPHSTESRSPWRQSSQPITWLILTNETVQENTQTKYNRNANKCKIPRNTNYPGSVTSFDTQTDNEMDWFYNAPEPTRGQSICFTNSSQCIDT